jgi:hypothetical protein
LNVYMQTAARPRGRAMRMLTRECFVGPASRPRKRSWQSVRDPASRMAQVPLTGVVHVHWLLARC